MRRLAAIPPNHLAGASNRTPVEGLSLPPPEVGVKACHQLCRLRRCHSPVLPPAYRLAVPALARILDEGEEVLVDVRRHGWVLTRPLALALAAVGLAIAGLQLRVPVALAWVLAALVAAAASNLLLRYLGWRATTFVVTDRRLMIRSGLVRTSLRELPLAAVADISCRRGLLGRLLGFGDVVIDSAGGRAQELLTAVPDPLGIQSCVVGGRSRSSDRPSLPEQLAHLDDLRRRGALSPEEFAAAKARLLRG